MPQFSVQNLKGQGHHRSNTSTDFRISGAHVYVRVLDHALAVFSAHCKLSLTIVRPETVSNWTDGRIHVGTRRRHLYSLLLLLLKHKNTTHHAKNESSVVKIRQP